MKTALLIGLMILFNTISQAGIIDDFAVKQRSIDRGTDNLATATYKKVESNGQIPEYTRQLVSYTPDGDLNYTDSLIYKRGLFITNRIVEGHSVGSGTSVIYCFNNFDLYGSANGFYLKLGETIGNGFVIISTNGPAGFSYSNFHSITDGYLYFPLTEFNGARLFNNINWIRIDFVNVDNYSGPIKFGLIDRRRK